MGQCAFFSWQQLLSWHGSKPLRWRLQRLGAGLALPCIPTCSAQHLCLLAHDFVWQRLVTESWEGISSISSF